MIPFRVSVRSVAFALLALTAFAMASCGRRSSSTHAAPAAVAPPVASAPAPPPVDPGPPDVQALAKAETELETLVAHVEAQTAGLVKGNDPTATDTTGTGPARQAWEAWGEPWVEHLAAIERALPPAPPPGEKAALTQAHRRLRVAFFELRMIPWVGPSQPLPLQVDFEKHVSNAREALAATREWLERAKQEARGS